MFVADIYARWQAKAPNEVWIDVREPEEWAEGTIPGVQRVSLGEVPAQLAHWDKSKSYVMICRSGNRSGKAAQALDNAGFTDVTNFKGGMLAWYEQQYPLETPSLR